MHPALPGHLTSRHLAVMAQEVLAWLKPEPEGLYLDCTLGAGGHAQMILDTAGAGSRLIGIDCDAQSLAVARERLRAYQGCVSFVQRRYQELEDILAELHLPPLHGVLFDLGVSSIQLDSTERGFSFQSDGPLDMRMDTTQKQTAAKLIAASSQQELSRIFRDYGEERWAVAIARAIVTQRQRSAISRTLELVDLVAAAVPRRHHPKRRHVATKVFQALRIAVNAELSGLDQALCAACAALRPGGRICVISFHSLEDRIVKNVIRQLARGCVCPPRQPVCTCGRKPQVMILTPKPMRPAQLELTNNPRARSARLRVAQRLAA